MAAAGSGRRKRTSTSLLIKEGFLQKKGGIIKSWSRRYFILNKQSLVYFRREQDVDGSGELQPLGRIFLSDIVTIVTDGVEKKRAFVFALHTKKRAVLLQAASTDDRLGWVEAIRKTLESEGEAERKDPFRKTLRRLRPGVKRITLVKDPEKGIGCTIKNAAGHILVNRIIEDGPIATTGVLRPGDEILDIHGTTVTGLSVSEVVEVIRTVPEEFLATVHPITALKKGIKADTSRTNYSTIIPQAIPTNGSRGNTEHPGFAVHDPIVTPSCDEHELDDCGNYDDEDDGDIPPPLPPRTEDALIIVDPPPNTSHRDRPKVPPRPLYCLQKDYETQRSTDLIYRPHRKPQLHPMMNKKSLSQGDSVEDDTFVPVVGGGVRPPRVHLYEEIKPQLIYVDVDVSSRQVV